MLLVIFDCVRGVLLVEVYFEGVAEGVVQGVAGGA